jgi:hypothetical protein
MLVSLKPGKSAMLMLMAICNRQYGQPSGVEDMNEPEYETVWGSVRVLCAWLAEETDALRPEVNGILPALLGWCAVDRRYDMLLVVMGRGVRYRMTR